MSDSRLPDIDRSEFVSEGSNGEAKKLVFRLDERRPEGIEPGQRYRACFLTEDNEPFLVRVGKCEAGRRAGEEKYEFILVSPPDSLHCGFMLDSETEEEGFVWVSKPDLQAEWFETVYDDSRMLPEIFADISQRTRAARAIDDGHEELDLGRLNRIIQGATLVRAEAF